MRDRDSRTRRWRRTLTGGFVLSLLAHVAFVLAFDVAPHPTDADKEADRDRDRVSTEWQVDELRVVQVREPASAPASGAAAPAPASPKVSRPSGPPPLPASSADGVPGSEAAGEALARFASVGGVGASPAPAESLGRGSRPSRDARATREVPPAVYDGRGEFRATSRAAKEAARSGHLPDLGDGAVAVSDRGRTAG